jgi:hypothetical protein
VTVLVSFIFFLCASVEDYQQSLTYRASSRSGLTLCVAISVTLILDFIKFIVKRVLVIR